ncbi:MAG: hypothetical protein ABIJ59_14995 [Pseudomonadota bacterium]
MAYIIFGLMICVFSIGMFSSSDLSIWGVVGICFGGFLILKGRKKSGFDE